MLFFAIETTRATRASEPECARSREQGGRERELETPGQTLRQRQRLLWLLWVWVVLKLPLQLVFYCDVWLVTPPGRVSSFRTKLTSSRGSTGVSNFPRERFRFRCAFMPRTIARGRQFYRAWRRTGAGMACLFSCFCTVYSR